MQFRGAPVKIHPVIRPRISYKISRDCLDIAIYDICQKMRKYENDTRLSIPVLGSFENPKVVSGAGGKGATGDRLCFTHCYPLLLLLLLLKWCRAYSDWVTWARRGQCPMSSEPKSRSVTTFSSSFSSWCRQPKLSSSTGSFKCRNVEINLATVPFFFRKSLLWPIWNLPKILLETKALSSRIA